MYGVPQAGLTVPAVAGQLERGVRPHCALEGMKADNSLGSPYGLAYSHQ
jgi:hypothetical protein